jgi:hypothetical protein
MMKQWFFFLIIVSLIGSTSAAQEDSASISVRIRSAADSMLAAFKQKDFRTFARFNNKKLLDVMGGAEQFAVFMDQQMKSMKDLSFTEIRAGRILRIIPYKNTWQCVLEQYSQISTQGMIISSVSHLVGLSVDKGVSWRFIDANQGSPEQFRAILPELNPDMPIPRKKQEAGKTLEELLVSYQTTYQP